MRIELNFLRMDLVGYVYLEWGFVTGESDRRGFL